MNAASEVSPDLMHVDLGGASVEVAASPTSVAYWRSVAAGRWEPATLRFMARAVRPGTVFVDVGAWVGPLSILAGKAGARVIALEPDAAAFAELSGNLVRNGVEAHAIEAALHTGADGLTLYAPGGAGRSVSTSFGEGAGMKARSISVDDLSTMIDAAKHAPEAAVVLKVDIEGHEYVLGEALADLWRRHSAQMHFSLHPRAIWVSQSDVTGDIGARRAAFRATMRLLQPFRTGIIRLASAPWAPLSPAALFQCFRTPRPKNFTVEIGPPSR